MADEFPDGASSAGLPACQRLTGWKAVAGHFRVSVRTVQRWARFENLPVHHHMHAALGSVYADRQELDVWWGSRPAAGEQVAAPGGPVRAIAVLPFADLDRERETGILADGLTEEIVDALARIEGLRVVAHGSPSRLMDRATDVREVATRLGVDAVLEGSVRRAADRVRVVAQLIDGPSRSQLWSEHFDHPWSEPLAVQEGIARALASALGAMLTATSRLPGSPDPVDRA